MRPWWKKKGLQLRTKMTSNAKLYWRWQQILETSDHQNSNARKNQWVELSTDLHKLYNFGRDQDGRYQASSCGEWRASISRWNIKNSFIWNIRLLVIQRRGKVWQFPLRLFFQRKIFHWDLDRKNEACSYEWQMKVSLNVEKRNLKRCFFGSFGLSGFWSNE